MSFVGDASTPIDHTLPALTGTEQDIREGGIERRHMLERLAEELGAKAGNASADLIASLIDLYRQVALRQTAAAWWINNSSHAIAPRVQRLFTGDDKARLAELAAKRTV